MLRASLLQILFAEQPQAKAGAVRIEADDAWNKGAQLAYGWGVLPRLSERIGALGLALPAEVAGEISRLVLDGYVRSVREAESGLRVLGELESAGVRAVAFKGLASMGCLYTDVKQRVIVDVDVLIAEADLARTAEVLRGLGFTPEVTCEVEEYVQFTRRAPGFGGNEEMSFRNGRGNTIDLHWRLGAGFDASSLLDGARPAVVLGKPFSAVAAVDGVLLCVHHSLRNHFSPDKILRDLQDLERWCEVLVETGTVGEILAAAERKGLTVPLLTMVQLLAGFQAEGAAARVAGQAAGGATAVQRQAAEQLEGLFAAQVRDGQMERDLLYLFRPRELRQILAGVLFGGRRHVEISASMDAALAGEPVGVWKRLAVLGRALRGLRPGQIGSLRALARAKDAFGGRGSAG